MNDLELYREELANCDAKITEALKERYAIIEKIMAYKEEYGMPILQPEQEEKQKKRLMFSLHNNKHRDEIYDVFERIQRNSKKIQARKLFDYNIVLIGFMGAGKSTISDYLSTMFAMEVVEMDQLIAEREGMSISDIFETYGEEYFRNMETNLLIEMQEKKNVIISCGGGVAMRERNVAEMKKNGRVVLLTAHPQTILDRVKDSDDRPLLNGHKNVEYIEQLMEARREKYEAAADIVVDTDNNCIDSYEWQIVPIDNDHCSVDRRIMKLIYSYKNETDQKYQRVVTRLARELTHPNRNQETELGNLLADAVYRSLNVNIAMFGSGAIRTEQLGPIVMYQDLKECLPYDDPIYMLEVTGDEFMRMVKYMVRDEVWQGEHCEFYQFSKGVEIVYNRTTKEFEKFEYQKEPIDKEKLYSISLAKFHYTNFDEFFHVSLDTIEARKKARIVSTSTNDIIEEYLSENQHLNAHIEGRLIVKD